jgi:hypothetical protein
MRHQQVAVTKQLLRNYGPYLEKKSLVALICRHCQFFKDSDKDLECGAFKILKGLLEKGVITPEEITDVIRK